MINEYLAGLKSIFGKLDVVAIQNAVELLNHRRHCRKTVFTFGNGGSASTASHFACDLAKNAYDTDYPFKAICLADNLPSITAYANDEGYENVFTGQLKRLLTAGDILLAISASGNSPNVVTAVQYAKDKGHSVIGLTGFDGGKLRQLADISIHVDSDVIEQVEDVHLMVCHIIVKSFKE